MINVVIVVWSRCVFTAASSAMARRASSSSPSSNACRQTASTTAETLIVRCFAGVLDAASHGQHRSTAYGYIRYCTNPYAMTLARRAAQAARLRGTSVNSGAKSGGRVHTDNRRHHVLIAPCMQSSQGSAVNVPKSSWCLGASAWLFTCCISMAPFLAGGAKQANMHRVDASSDTISHLSPTFCVAF